MLELDDLHDLTIISKVTPLRKSLAEIIAIGIILHCVFNELIYFTLFPLF